jgi:hypothetical protein
MTWTTQKSPDGKRYEVIDKATLNLAGTYYSFKEAWNRARLLNEDAAGKPTYEELAAALSKLANGASAPLQADSCGRPVCRVLAINVENARALLAQAGHKAPSVWALVETEAGHYESTRLFRTRESAAVNARMVVNEYRNDSRVADEINDVLEHLNEEIAGDAGFGAGDDSGVFYVQVEEVLVTD